MVCLLEQISYIFHDNFSNNSAILGQDSHVFCTKLDTFMPQLACFWTEHIRYKCELNIKTRIKPFLVIIWNIQQFSKPPP